MENFSVEKNNATTEQFSIAASDSLDSITQETSSVTTLVKRYCYLEKRYHQATEELKVTASLVVERVEADHPGDETFDDIDKLYGASEVLRESQKLEEFRCRSNLARRFCVPYRVVAGSRFVNGVSGAELKKMNSIEMQIQLIRYKLEKLEHLILDTPPRSVQDALAKLRFTSDLLIEGVPIDIDHYAYLINEAVDVCEGYMK